MPPIDSTLWSSLIASLVPVVVGATTVYFRIFVEPVVDFRNRINLQRKTLIEQVASKHTALLQRVRSITEDDLLRGDGREEPDLVGELSSEVFRVFTIFHRFETLRLMVRGAYWILFTTIAVGLLGALTASAWAAARTYVPVVGIVMVIIQVLTVMVILVASNKLEVYEDVS